MIEFILDILFNYPEGISFALFGIGKKKRKAEKMLKQLDSQGVSDIEASGFDSSEIPQFNTNGSPRRSTIKAPTASTYQPVFPYAGRQIIIDSGRVLLNSKDDSTFIIGKKAVGISTGGTFNVDTAGKTIINSPEIDLGLNAKHPIILGDEFMSSFQQFLLAINATVVPQLEAATDSNEVKIATVIRAGEALKAAVTALNEVLPETLSQTVKSQ